MSVLHRIVKESIANGWFDEVTEDILNDEQEFNTMVDVFVSEIMNNLQEFRKKRVIRNKKLKLRVICPKNKRYVASKKQCVRVSGAQRVKKRWAMK